MNAPVRRTDARRQAVRHVGIALTAGCAALPLGGCARAPSFNILGSFFPAWLICIVAGILLTTLSHWVFVRLNFDKAIAWTIVVYPCLTGLFACTLWLIFFS